MRRVVAGLAIGFVLAGIVAAAASASAPATVQTYLVKIRPAVVLAEQAQRQVVVAYTDPPAGQGPKMIRSSAASFVKAAGMLSRVAAPAQLREAHGDLRHALRLEADALRVFAVSFGTTAETPKADAWLSNAATLAASWRQELIAQLRRAGVAVPVWVKLLALG
jgi:hypothetical protein